MRSEFYIGSGRVSEATDCFFGKFMLLIHLVKQEFSKKCKLLIITEGGYMEEEKEKMLQWHPAFYAGLQIELSEEAEYLEFESEHMLSSKPMQLDVLIIKKNKERQIRKNIGRIFRTYNIIEYKSPEDYLSIDDFYKVYGYTCFYKSDTGEIDKIKAEELTISFVCSHYPRELIRYLKQKQYRVIEEKEKGIYYISDTLFKIQLIVTKKLSNEVNLWLRNLTNDLKEKEAAERLLWDYGKHQTNKLYRAVMNIIVRANEERFKVSDMCEALEELMKERIEEREKFAESRGEQQKLLSMIEKKLAKGKSVAQIADELEETEEAILPLYNSLKENFKPQQDS